MPRKLSSLVLNSVPLESAVLITAVICPVVAAPLKLLSALKIDKLIDVREPIR
jgi:hypothetical protein